MKLEIKIIGLAILFTVWFLGLWLAWTVMQLYTPHHIEVIYSMADRHKFSLEAMESIMYIWFSLFVVTYFTTLLIATRQIIFIFFSFYEKK